MHTSTSTLCQSGLYKKTLNYWRLSHAWRAHAKEAGPNAPRTMADLIDGISNNFSMGIHTDRLLGVESVLLQQVIHNKRCRKTKPIQNIVQLVNQIVKVQTSYDEAVEAYRQQFWG